MGALSGLSALLSTAADRPLLLDKSHKLAVLLALYKQLAPFVVQALDPAERPISDVVGPDVRRPDVDPYLLLGRIDGPGERTVQSSALVEAVLYKLFQPG